MTREEKVIDCYKKVLSGEQKAFPPQFLADQCYQQEKIKLLYQYAFEELEHWTPEEAREKISEEYIKDKKLVNTLKYIKKPKGLADGDYSYIAEYIYPELAKETVEEYAIRIYKKVLNGQLSKYPKGFFDEMKEDKGERRSVACVRYAFTELMELNEEEIALLFSKNECNKTLKEYKLSCLLPRIFESRKEIYEIAFKK